MHYMHVLSARIWIRIALCIALINLIEAILASWAGQYLSYHYCRNHDHSHFLPPAWRALFLKAGKIIESCTTHLLFQTLASTCMGRMHDYIHLIPSIEADKGIPAEIIILFSESPPSLTMLCFHWKHCLIGQVYHASSLSNTCIDMPAGMTSYIHFHQ